MPDLVATTNLLGERGEGLESPPAPIMVTPLHSHHQNKQSFLTEHLPWLLRHQFEIENIGIGRFQIILWNFSVLAKSYRSSPPYVFLGKGVLKICSKSKGEHPCQSVISIKGFFKFIQIIFWHGYFPLNLLHIFPVSFLKITPWEMFLKLAKLLRIKSDLHKCFIKGLFLFLSYFNHVIFLFWIFAMAQLLRIQTPNPGGLISKAVVGANVDTVFHPSVVNRIYCEFCKISKNTGHLSNFLQDTSLMAASEYSWKLGVISELPLRSGSVALRQLNPTHERSHKVSKNI